MNIIEFIRDVLEDSTLSIAQTMALKAFYGLTLSEAELSVFRETSGLRRYTPHEWNEGTFILGRRSGKSDKLASNIALYEACSRRHHFTRGQVGIVMVVASEKRRQAKIVFDYMLNKLQGTPRLRRMIRTVTQESIALTNGVEIQCFPCDAGKVRGFSLVAFVADEVASWMHEGKRIDKDVLDAARPGLDFDYSKMVKISTPAGMKGEIWSDYKQYWGKANEDVLVLRGSTQLFNPLYTQRRTLVKRLERLRKRKPSSYRVEHLAEFRKEEDSMFTHEAIEGAVDKRRPMELRYDPSNRYFIAHLLGLFLEGDSHLRKSIEKCRPSPHFLGKRLYDGNRPSYLFVRRNRLRTRPCGFRPHVYYRRTITSHPQAVLNSSLGIEKLSPVAEGIRRDIQHPHNDTPSREIQSSARPLNYIFIAFLSHPILS